MNHSPEQKLLRAARLKKLRKMTHYSRKAFSEKYNISQGTLQNWETARFGGLTEKGAHTMIQALSTEGLFCSFEWLMYGVGNSPTITDVSTKQTTQTKKANSAPEEELINAQLKLFKDLNPDAADFLVADDSMSPHYKEGQILAGRKRTGKEIEKLVNKTCIIETADKTQLLRYIKKGNKQNTYNISCLNKDAKVIDPFIYNAVLISAAPVTWVRTTDK
ncbi:MAG: hypothetical protein HON55_00250 [Legionellales bacterium]|jgi:HTH-type transcriptional regulator, cell division transcriptional repressor|nr:hypothetical protein [Legionellales bacterium]